MSDDQSRDTCERLITGAPVDLTFVVVAGALTVYTPRLYIESDGIHCKIRFDGKELKGINALTLSLKVGEVNRIDIAMIDIPSPWSP